MYAYPLERLVRSCVTLMGACPGFISNGAVIYSTFKYLLILILTASELCKDSE